MTPSLLRSDRLTRGRLLGALAMGAFGAWVTRDAWIDIHHIAWQDEEYSHIFIVPVVAIVMVWVRRMRFRHCRVSGTIIGPLIVAAGWGLSSFGFYNAHQSLWHGGSVLVVLGCMLSVLGKNVLFQFFPAVAVLIFLIPVPSIVRQSIALPLQAYTAQIAQALLEIFGVDSNRSGNLLSINGTDVTIAEACNGLRMVFPLILVSYAFSFALPLRNSVRFLVLLASPLAAIFCNVVRILPTIWLYGYASPSFADAFHEYSGWAMVPIAFLMLLSIIKLLKWAMIPVMRYTLASQ